MSTDPRGPLRRIVSVEHPTRDGGTFVRIVLDCGHVREPASHFAYRPGDDYHCFLCRASASALPE